MPALSEPQTTSGTTVQVPQHIVHRSFPTETVVLNLETGKYHGLNPTGGRMLEVVERAATVGDAVAILVEEFGQPADEMERDLCAFCDDLAARGLITLDGGN